MTSPCRLEREDPRHVDRLAAVVSSIAGESFGRVTRIFTYRLGLSIAAWSCFTWCHVASVSYASIRWTSMETVTHRPAHLCQTSP